MGLYWVRSDGGGDPQLLAHRPSFGQTPGSWHPNGRLLASSEGGADEDLMILPVDGDEASGWKPGQPYAFLKTPARETAPIFSPDGRWLAYQSDESGANEVYVRPFPSREGKWQISNKGGLDPVWSRAKQELLYRTPDNQIMVVSYTVSGDSMRADAPRLWTNRRVVPPFARTGARSMDLHPDGERLAASVASDNQAEARQNTFLFISNFFDELRRIAPSPR